MLFLLLEVCFLVLWNGFLGGGGRDYFVCRWQIEEERKIAEYFGEKKKKGENLKIKREEEAASKSPEDEEYKV